MPDRRYKTQAWRRFRLAVLARDGYRCQVQGPNCTVHATQVDRIVPVTQDPSRFFDPSKCRAARRSCNAHGPHLQSANRRPAGRRSASQRVGGPTGAFADVGRGRKMHIARHTAGQSVLDQTGNLTAVQKLLGHASITRRATSTPTGISPARGDDALRGRRGRRGRVVNQNCKFVPPGLAKSLQISGLCAWEESNLRPRAPEARALSPELQALGRQV